MNNAAIPDSPLVFALEPYGAQLISEMRPLWNSHHKEIPQLGLSIDPDLACYESMADKNMLRIFTARFWNEDVSLLVGYQVFGVMKHPHRRYNTEAIQQLLYLEPECRKGFAAIRFLKYCWEELKTEGVRVIHQQISAANDFGLIFERYGFVRSDVTFSRIM